MLDAQKSLNHKNIQRRSHQLAVSEEAPLLGI